MENQLPRLHAHYAELAEREPWSLSEEQRRSVRFYRAEIALLAGASIESIGQRDEQWARQLINLDAFVNRRGRLPRENNRLDPHQIDATEQRLVNWVRGQRKANAAGRLTEYQQQRLLCIPGFSFNPIEDRWASRLAAYRRFLSRHHRAPMIRSSHGEERKLAAWAAKQRMHYRRGTLSEPRVDALAALDFWTWG